VVNTDLLGGGCVFEEIDQELEDDLVILLDDAEVRAVDFLAGSIEYGKAFGEGE
jgi:hypothetical protein